MHYEKSECMTCEKKERIRKIPAVGQKQSARHLQHQGFRML